MIVAKQFKMGIFTHGRGNKVIKVSSVLKQQQGFFNWIWEDHMHFGATKDITECTDLI